MPVVLSEAPFNVNKLKAYWISPQSWLFIILFPKRSPVTRSSEPIEPVDPYRAGRMLTRLRSRLLGPGAPPRFLGSVVGLGRHILSS
jgi:hypothetical protein